MNIIEKADKYADGKANEAITKAIAQAYLDGYRDGYNDREAEIPADFRDNKTTYIDLGLPSRTLWSEDYEKDGGSLLYLPYERAEYLKIPTEEQWQELLDECEMEIEWIGNSGPNIQQVIITGPNGNILRFKRNGMIKSNNSIKAFEIYFWLEDQDDSSLKNAVHISHDEKYAEKVRLDKKEVVDIFSGYRLPVRLVR